MWIFWPNPESLPVCRIVIIRMHIGLKRTTRIKLEIELIHFLKSLIDSMRMRICKIVPQGQEI